MSLTGGGLTPGAGPQSRASRAPQAQPAAAPLAGSGIPAAGGDSGSDYGDVRLSEDCCCEIGAYLVASQNHAIEVQGYEVAAFSDPRLGRRILQHLRDLGPGTAGLPVCLVPAGRAAVLDQLQDELPNLMRLLSNQRGGTPLPDDVAQQLQDTAGLVQAAYTRWTLQRRTLRQPRRGRVVPSTASGSAGRQGRPQRSASRASCMSVDSPPLSVGGASAATDVMSVSSGGGAPPPPALPPSRRGRSSHKNHAKRNRHRHGSAAAGGGQ